MKISEDNLYVWEAQLKGPEGTPYEGGTFHFKLKFEIDYPFVAPTVSNQ